MSRGFSLLELLVSMTIVAVLAGISWPGYQRVVQRTLRQEARLALMRIEHGQERHFSMHHVYARSLDGGESADALAMSSTSDSGYYLLSLETPDTGDRYTAIARPDPRARQAADRQCAYLSVNETGQRRAADATGQWHDDDPDRCWG